MAHVDLDRIARTRNVPRAPVHIVALVLTVDQLAQKIVAVDVIADADREEHVAVLIRIGRRIDAGDGGDDDRVAPFQYGVDGRHPKHVQLVVGHRVLFNIRIRLGHVRFRLVVIEIGNEVFHTVVRKQLLEFRIQLAGQRLVMGEHQRRPVDALDHIADRKRLARSGRAQ